MNSPENKFDYAPAPESKALASIASDYGLFINGKFQSPHSKKKFESINPATEEILGLLRKVFFFSRKTLSEEIK